MASMYENATLTSIAACAEGVGAGSEGFFQAKQAPEIDLEVAYGEPTGSLLLRIRLTQEHNVFKRVFSVGDI